MKLAYPLRSILFSSERIFFLLNIKTIHLSQLFNQFYSKLRKFDLNFVSSQKHTENLNLFKMIAIFGQVITTSKFIFSKTEFALFNFVSKTQIHLIGLFLFCIVASKIFWLKPMTHSLYKSMNLINNILNCRLNWIEQYNFIVLMPTLPTNQWINHIFENGFLLF